MPGSIHPKPWIVQKYGGTSLGKLLPTITGSIIPQYLENNNVTIVCSAISGTSKSAGTTSLLLQAIQDAMKSRITQKSFEKIVDTIRDEHLRISERLFIGAEKIEQLSAKKELDDGIVEDCDGVRGFLAAAQVFLQKDALIAHTKMQLMISKDNRRALCKVQRSCCGYRGEVGMSNCGSVLEERGLQALLLPPLH
jgi:aspartokinase